MVRCNFCGLEISNGMLTSIPSKRFGVYRELELGDFLIKNHIITIKLGKFFFFLNKDKVLVIELNDEIREIDYTQKNINALDTLSYVLHEQSFYLEYAHQNFAYYIRNCDQDDPEILFDNDTEIFNLFVSMEIDKTDILDLYHKIKKFQSF